MPKAALERARPAVVVAVALLLAACGGGADDPDDAASSGSESASESPEPAEPTATATYDRPTVDPPADDPGTLVGDDMLIIGEETIDEELVEEVRKLEVKGQPAFAEVEQLSIGQISVENEVYDVAAVDIDGYRRFTPIESARFDEQWERLAGGEFATTTELEGQLPLDDTAHLAAGSGEQVHLIHAGAYAPQAAGADIVVNEAWGERLGMPEGNALLMSTGILAPQAVREPLKKLLGKDFAIQDLDAVKEYGLDPDAYALLRPVGTFGDAVGVFRYRPLKGGRIAPDPAWVKAHIVTDTVPILGRVTCNKHMMPQLKAALAQVVEDGLADEIHPEEYAGCYYPRFIAGSTKLSNHSFGLALDFNVPGNQRGTAGQMHRSVVAIFKKWGFAWGGDWSYTDPMHFELARIVNPGG